MKAAIRLSSSFVPSILFLVVSATVTAQMYDGPSSSFEQRRAPWIASPMGGVTSAEFGTQEAADRALLNSARPSAPKPSRPASGTVSLARLQNPPPAKAKKELEKGAKAAAEGNREEAVKHYERAIEIHRGYVEAYNNLGVQCIKLGRTEQALDALEKAAELDPDSFEPHLNLAVALHGAGRLEAAAYQAERAVELAPQSASANLGLGLVLTAQGRNLEEAVRRLQFASSEHPGASLAAADALLQLERPKDAQVVLRSFLSRAQMAVQ